MSSIETGLDRAIEDLVYTLQEPPARVAWSHRLYRGLRAIVVERGRQEEIGRTKRAGGIDWRSCADPEMAGGDDRRFAVLGEEVGEVARALLERGYGTEFATTLHLRAELIEVAAVALAWIESIDQTIEEEIR